MAQGRAFRPSKTAWLDRNQIRERLEFKNLILVDDTGIEPVTPTMSMWCSTAEPIVRGGVILAVGYFRLN